VNLTKDFGPFLGLISMQSGTSTSKNIATLNDLDEEIEIAKEVLKVQFILNKKTWVLHHRLFFTWHFFVVTNGSKLQPIIP
jgi:hypothetical protein